MPFTAGLYYAALARPAAQLGCVAAGRQPRRVLRRLLLGLGAIMAVEKNMPWGRQISHPLGVVLVTWGALVVAVNTL